MHLSRSMTYDALRLDQVMTITDDPKICSTEQLRSLRGSNEVPTARGNHLWSSFVIIGLIAVQLDRPLPRPVEGSLFTSLAPPLTSPQDSCFTRLYRAALRRSPVVVDLEALIWRLCICVVSSHPRRCRCLVS